MASGGGGVRESTLIYACSRKTAKEITVQMLTGNVKRALKQIVVDLIVDLSKTPSRSFEVWNMESKSQIPQSAGVLARQGHFIVCLCSSAATESTADMTSKPFALTWQDFAEIWVGTLQNDLCGVEGVGTLTGEGLSGVPSSSQACTTMSSK